MKDMRCILLALAAATAPFLFVSPALAQPDAEGQAAPVQRPASKEGACKDDIQKLCPDASTLADRMKCLKEHEAALSASCRQSQDAAKQQARARLEKAKAACQSDIDKYCRDAKEGEGRIASCLKSHEGDLTPGCKTAYDRIDIQAQKPRIAKAFDEACKDDLVKFCDGKPKGSFGKIKCLKAHTSQLSESCQSAMPGKPPLRE
jgi:hypothetical protein